MVGPPLSGARSDGRDSLAGALTLPEVYRELVAQLATLPLAFQAEREGPDSDWVIRPHVEPADPVPALRVG